MTPHTLAETLRDLADLPEEAAERVVRGLSVDQLANLSRCCDAVQVASLVQDDTTAGALVEPRRPGLAGRSEEALRLLMVPFEELARDLLVSARQAVGLTQAIALTPPVKGEEAAALVYYGIPLDDAKYPLARNLGDPWFAHLQRWERRHHEVVDALVLDLSSQGHATALGEMSLEEAVAIQSTALVRERLPAHFETTGTELGIGLRKGTNRSSGLVDILQMANTIGAAALYIRRLFDAERPVLELLADRATWVSYSEGYRLAAIEGTHALLNAADAMPKGGLVLAAANIPVSVLNTLTRYAWAGPQDRQTCGACSDRKGYETYAFSVEEMPACQEICGLRDACRHFYVFTPPSSGDK